MKKRAIKLFTLFFLAGLLFASCTTQRINMAEPNARVEFEKNDFTFSNQVIGEATSTRVLFIDWRRLFRKEYGSIRGNMTATFIPVIGQMIMEPTNHYALYDMMKNNPGYDVVFYPQFEISETKSGPIGIFYHRTEVKATARLAKIKD